MDLYNQCDRRLNLWITLVYVISGLTNLFNDGLTYHMLFYMLGAYLTPDQCLYWFWVDHCCSILVTILGLWKGMARRVP